MSQAWPQLDGKGVKVPDNADLNKLEDLALTQTMFEHGSLIYQGDASEFVNIIR